jgi:hypothetical protein
MEQQYGLELLKENQELRQKLEQYKRALELAILHDAGFCPVCENLEFCPFEEDNRVMITCDKCVFDYYLKQAKGGQ